MGSIKQESFMVEASTFGLTDHATKVSFMKEFDMVKVAGDQQA